MNTALILAFALQSLTYGAPFLFAALGEVFSERSGVINIGLEGLMLVGALAAIMGSAITGDPMIGVVWAMLAATVVSALFALFAIGLKRDQVIVGTTVNFLALGLTGMVYRAWTGGGGRVIPAKTIPALFGNGGTAVNALTLLALLLVPVAHGLLFRTRFGVTIRATGEVPAAAAAAGARVNVLRTLTTLATGALCGLGGASLSIGIASTFTEGMTSGRGFIALAVVVFGRWTPFGALAASLLFAAADVAQARLQAAGWFSVPYPLFLMVPYVLTLVALTVRGARVQSPAALGQSFEQG
ncbi:MAG: ABC transporter permease [Capsulimonadales bacterium]|nr:ABC transporter permease [Capsulimonadales bacterium]